MEGCGLVNAVSAEIIAEYRHEWAQALLKIWLTNKDTIMGVSSNIMTVKSKSRGSTAYT